jgi:hypothetical protein
MNPNIDLPSVGARLGVYRAAFDSELHFLSELQHRLAVEVQNAQHQVHLLESEHAQAFYAMRALQPVHLTTGSDAHAPAV